MMNTPLAVTVLFEADDQHFTWMLGGPAQTAGLHLAPGEADKRVIEWLQRLAARFRASNRVGVWRIVIDNEVVGSCCYKQAPDSDGTVEIGYGVKSSRRGRGYATRAIAELINIASRDILVHRLMADTAVANIASQRVLERNAFVRTGTRSDPEDGELIVWHRELNSATTKIAAPTAPK